MPFLKILSSFVFSIGVAVACVWIAHQIVQPDPLTRQAVLISVAEATGNVTTPDAISKPEGPDPVLSLLAGADPGRGKTLAKVCAACHTFDKGGRNGVGPNLWGVVDRPKESIAGFAYSGVLGKAGGKNWTYIDLNKFLWKPKDYAPGTKMSFMGVKKPEDRAAVIAYLRTLADAPVPLPSDADIQAEATTAP